MHANADNTIDGQDIFAPTGSSAPVTITGGTENPNPSLQSVANISRSDSVVNVPVYDGGCVGGGGGCSPTKIVVGFLQLGLTQTMTGATRVQAVILNASGCNPANNGNPVAGDGVSPLPVRLITP
jgi:hypothetical protein